MNEPIPPHSLLHYCSRHFLKNETSSASRKTRDTIPPNQPHASPGLGVNRHLPVTQPANQLPHASEPVRTPESPRNPQAVKRNSPALHLDRSGRLKSPIGRPTYTYIIPSRPNSSGSHHRHRHGPANRTDQIRSETFPSPPRTNHSSRDHTPSHTPQPPITQSGH